MKIIRTPPTVHLADGPSADLTLVVREDAVATTASTSPSPRSRTFVVSSATLSRASPLFAAMFGPHFAEGHRLREQGAQGARATATLEEDDVDAMEFVLRHLHGKLPPRAAHHMAVDTIAQVAVQADKYDLVAALAPWAALWCDSARRPPAEEVGDWIFVAWVFRVPEFQEASARWAAALRPGTVARWEEDEVLSRLPKCIGSFMEDEVTRAKVAMHDTVITNRPRMTDICGDDRIRPSRFADALAWLGIQSVSSLVKLQSINEIVATLEQLPEAIGHRCAKGKKGECAILTRIENLCRSARVVRACMQGVPSGRVFTRSLPSSWVRQPNGSRRREHTRLKFVSFCKGGEATENAVSPSEVVDLTVKSDDWLWYL